ncbi:MAG: Stk1 family PASTA domain-containing Ser/Thr kinase [Clostridia bacterium]|nr:Stk1 family PASTA domain-containing Ser/Thr kinase [Clostridia bacterium]
MDLKGRLLGNRYEIIEKIGNGGMATVYKAKCHVLNRYVAIKILRDEFTTDEEFIKRFEVEAQSAASITHPNIVSVYDVGVDGNLYYIVMELIKGKTLKDIIIEEKGPLPWKWSVNIAIQIASALEIAHKNSIVHRDIKPHNIIITEDGVAKVTDFGIAKAVSNSTITAFGSTIGSVHYFSPEHARGGFTDAKSDLYSLGVVMYEMLTGKVPFDADTPVSIALKHMQEEPKTAKEMNPNIPSAVNDIITKALKKDTNLRYQSATSMVFDLKRALKEPTGNFVSSNDYQEDFPTQRFSTLGVGEDRGPKSAKGKAKKPNKFVMFIKKHKVLSSIVGLFILFAISLGATIGIANATRPKEVAIPNLVGKTVEEVKQILAENKLNYVEDESEFNTEYEAGQIISQNPPYKEGRFIKENTDVKVVISLGTEKTTVPVLKGLTKEEAETTAKEAKIKLEIIEEISKTVEAGYIVKQETEPDTEVNAGDTVKVYLSIGTGIEQVVVSSVLYKEEAVAKKTLEDIGLVVEVEYSEDKERGNGVVLKQSVASGETVDEGSKVVITVNKLVEAKECKVVVNVAKLTDYTVKTEEVEGPDGEMTEQEVEAEKVTVTISVDGSVYDSGSTKRDNKEYSRTVSATGKIPVKIEIKDSKGNSLATKTKTVDFNKDTSVTFE